MKRILKQFFIELMALYFINLAIGGLIFENGLETIFLTAVALTITSYLIKPIINILLLPINLLTFGLFRWISSAIAFYLITLVVPGFKILYFSFLGLSTNWFDIPSISLKGFMAFIAFSFLISLVVTFLHWVFK